MMSLSTMVDYSTVYRTKKSHELAPFFGSEDNQIQLANVIVQLVPDFLRVSKRVTPNSDRKITQVVLQDFFPGLGGKNNEYRPSTLESLDGGDKISASMVTTSIHLANEKMNIVCNQMSHNQISEQDHNIFQRMNQMTRSSSESSNVTLIPDSPQQQQPYSVQKLAAEMMETDVGLT